ncbi:type I secretion system permease/ATPase [Rhodovulum adriaticum]|uniref:ATP-binding cassette subfamily C protein n=1 Tax=Rhodovulum adriaticum TaxID=35804 RepID=A0A4R2NW85_RHOAD|nr:type I secretion system permease/ATPase [Rhodovulum adriaticum]MBK1635283.1 type I secretion system permease/ATPase [Rhodovulum adriaticum]TCP26419.1 ATP-binding cassette subfamily C protein [Rhodovulum adriaticum]
MAVREDTPEVSLGRIRGRALFVAVVLFSVFTNLLMLTGPLFMLQVYDRVLSSRSEETLLALLILVAALYLFYWLLDYARGRVAARIGTRLQTLLNRRVFVAVVERAALRGGKGPGTAALYDLDALRNLSASPVFLALFDLPWTPLFLAAIFLFHPLMGWLAVAGGALLIVVSVINQLLSRRALDEAQRIGHGAQRLARQAEESGALVWSQGMAPVLAERWAQVQDRAGEAALRANDRGGTFTSFSRAFRLFLQSAMLALGAWLVLRNQLTPGAMIASSILLGRALVPVEQILGQWPTIQRARTAWRSLAEFLEALPARRPPTELPRPEARLKVSGLALRSDADGAPPVLQGIDFELAPGEALGVIGKSGAGKTSLARAILGLVQPAAGQVRLAGATLDQYAPEILGRHIGCLPQDVRFFDGTVAENIAHMAQEPDAARVVEAAKLARVHEIVLRLPEGYDTELSAGGHLLSGGQRQRLALARALYHDPVLLVLDEPNSALDAEGSEALNAVVADMKKARKSVLIMTHRPSAIAVCDRLLVLDGGRQKALGPRDEVVRAMMKNASDVQRAMGTAAAAPREATG